MGQAEVCDPQRAMGVDEQVGRFDISMHHAELMGVIERLGGLSNELGRIAEKVGAQHSGRQRSGLRVGGRIGRRNRSARLRSRGDHVRFGRVIASAAVRAQRETGRFRRERVRLFQLRNHMRQRLAVNELHGVIMNAAFVAHGIHRHDVRMVELRGGLRLVAEPLYMRAIDGGGERQDLDRHAAIQRDLRRLVDHAHPAAADLS